MDYIACQAPQPMGFSRQEYWSGLPFPSLGDLPNPGIEPTSPALAVGFFIAEPPRKPFTGYIYIKTYQILEFRAVHFNVYMSVIPQ